MASAIYHKIGVISETLKFPLVEFWEFDLEFPGTEGYYVRGSGFKLRFDHQFSLRSYQILH